MTKKAYEKITELLKQNKNLTEIIEALRHAHKHILISKYSDDSDMNRHILSEEEINILLKFFIEKRGNVQLQLKELGYYD